MKDIVSVTVQAPVNIAAIKYCGHNYSTLTEFSIFIHVHVDDSLFNPSDGKRNEEQILAINDSLSLSLSLDDLCATTTVAISSSFTDDRMWLNGKENPIESNKRLFNLLRKVRSKSKQDRSNDKIHICSENNFPTAAGMASSAAGYACLVFALGKLFGILDEAELSQLARLGSGSACRSIFGGFVEWVSGSKSTSSFAKQFVPADYWPEMRCIVLILNERPKERSSSLGMSDAVKTSTLIHYRASKVVPNRITDIKKAIMEKDFETFATITMKDSNQLHAIMQDTWPPLQYMNDISWSVVDMIHAYNEFYGKNKVAYSFDAGPNAFLFLLDDVVGEILCLLKHFYPPNSIDYKYQRGYYPSNKFDVSSKLLQFMENKLEVHQAALAGLISTRGGDGPRVISKSLLDGDGLPFRNEI